MGKILFGLLILSSVFPNVVCLDFEVHYEVNNFDELENTRISHEIFRRSVLNASSTAPPTLSMKTTSSIRTNPKASFNATVYSLPTFQPTVKRASHPTDKNTHHSTKPPWATTTRGTQQQHNNVTSRSPVLPTVMPTNSTNATNITIYQDNHKYFKSVYYPSGERFWFDLSDGPGTPKLHVGLTKNLQYSDTINTSFKFPYYGHEVNQVTITNKGFLFLGENVHKFNASMQYVAPLMADLGAHLDNETTIHYVDTGARFTVEWKNIKLQKQQAGKFSFQCSILKDGTIVFAYKDIPVAVSTIKNNAFPVRVGLSDGFLIRYVSPWGIYIINGRIYFRIIRYAYYRYHEVKLQKKQVKSGAAFVMTPLPNCVVFKSCDSCVNSKTQFSCEWCPALQRCSDGIDRHRESWLVAKCHVNSETTCQRTTKGPKTETTPAKGSNQKTKSRGGSSSKKRAGMAVLIVFFVLILVAIACWLAYAYTHPLSKSGMFLMRYGNPRKWCRNSENGSSGGGKITFKSMSLESTA